MTIVDLLGWLTLLIIILISIFTIIKYPKTQNFLITALLLRSIFVILDQYYITLPDSTADANRFEYLAFQYSKNHGIDIVSQFFTTDSFFISKFISIFYTFFGRSDMMAKMISVGFGTFSVFLIYHLVLIICNERSAIRAGWFVALFPSFVLYSALILREVYIIFFLTLALIGSVNFIEKKKIIDLVKSLSGFLIASLFHGPMIIGLFIFMIYISFNILKNNNFFIKFKKKNFYLILILPIFIFPLIGFFLGYYSIPKIGNFQNFGNMQKAENLKIEEVLIWKIKKATRSSNVINTENIGASYPEWTIPKNNIELIYLSPLRIFYFLYSPFPWDIKRPIHLIGLFDASIYIFLTYYAFCNRKDLFNNPKTLFLILILFVYVFVYSFGVGNFGTGIRHRLKFIGILLALAAQKIPRLKLF